jgi:hypothetical protein
MSVLYSKHQHTAFKFPFCPRDCRTARRRSLTMKTPSIKCAVRCQGMGGVCISSFKHFGQRVHSTSVSIMIETYFLTTPIQLFGNCHSCSQFQWIFSVFFGMERTHILGSAQHSFFISDSNSTLTVPKSPR